MFQTSFIPQGWECPKCKRVYSPTTNMCSHCPKYTQGVATTLSVNKVGSSTTFIGHNFKGNKKQTKCEICGLEKSQHPMISYTKSK